MPSAPGLPDMPIYQITVGERGHIVLPAELRHCCHLSPHEKLLIFRFPWATSVLLIAKIADIPELVQCFYTGSNKTSGDRRRAVLMVTSQGEAVMQACYHDVMTALLPLLLAVAPADIEQMAKSIGKMRMLMHNAHNLLNETEYRHEERCTGTNTAVCADN